MLKKIFVTSIFMGFALVAFVQINAEELDMIPIPELLEADAVEVDTGDVQVVTDGSNAAVNAGGTQVLTDGSGTSVNAGGLIINVKNDTSGMYLNLKGKIVLKVEDKGQAYYVHPKVSKLYSLGKPTDAFAVMRQQGVGIATKDLEKIEVATVGVFGVDTDKDGLSDLMEDGLGTDRNKKDTDGDGFDDKQEVEGGFNPLGTGKKKFDANFAKGQKGRIFIQTEKNGEAWYVSPSNQKRYFLGRPADAFGIMRALGLGITNKDFSNI